MTREVFKETGNAVVKYCGVLNRKWECVCAKSSGDWWRGEDSRADLHVTCIAPRFTAWASVDSRINDAGRGGGAHRTVFWQMRALNPSGKSPKSILSVFRVTSSGRPISASPPAFTTELALFSAPRSQRLIPVCLEPKSQRPPGKRITSKMGPIPCAKEDWCISLGRSEVQFESSASMCLTVFSNPEAESASSAEADRSGGAM